MQLEPQNHDPVVDNGPSTTLKVVVLVILIVLLVVGIVLPIKLVPNAFHTVTDKVSSWFTKDKAVEVTVDKSTVSSGETTTLSWNNAPSKDGTYALSYGCQTGVEVQTSIISPNETIACGGNYYFSTATTSIALNVFSTTTKYVEVPITLSYLENGATTTKELSSVVVSVSNTGATPVAVATSTPVVTPSVSPSPAVATATPAKPATPSNSTITRAHRVSNPNGKSDLSVRIIAVGYMNDNAEFIPAASVTSTMRPAIKFVVTNIGDKNSGAWNFTTSLPTPYHPTYSAYNLPNLGPDDSIAYVLGFDGIYNSRYNSVSITVDPQSLIGDTNRTNNTAQSTITNASAY